MNGMRAGFLAAVPGGIIAFLALVAMLPADPPPGVTLSESPWTDEAWSVLGARNMALLGTWATDELQTYLVQLPFHVALVAVFEATGVGIVQARALSVALSVTSVVLVSLLATRHFGRAAGGFAGIGLASAALFLYYGRLADLEPMVMGFLCAGAAALLIIPPQRWRTAGLIGGACLAIAIGTKPSAVAAAAGILLGAGLAARLGSRMPIRHLLVAGSVIVAAGIGWGVVVALPNWPAIETTFRFWPSQPLPETALDWVIRVGRYVRASDGAHTLTLPLYVAAATGVVLSWRGWADLDGRQRMVVGAAVGWAVFGMLLISFTAYRPNRYVVPLLPALAILGGVGVALVLSRLRLSDVRRRTAAAAMAAAVAAPGLVIWSGWLAGATHHLPRIQAEVAAIVGVSGAVQGGMAPALAMRAPVPAIVPRPAIDLNGGDLYESHGVRWIVADESYEPAWAGLHPDAWAARETVQCWPWGEDANECLISLP